MLSASLAARREINAETTKANGCFVLFRVINKAHRKLEPQPAPTECGLGRKKNATAKIA